MTRKDYVMIAEVILASKPGFASGDYAACYASDRTDVKNGCNAQWTWMAERLTDALQADNARFDRDRFLKACGVTR